MNQIPNHLNQKILNDIKSRLNPDLKVLFSKLLIIHLTTALVTMSICPQFGIAFFRSNLNLMDVFMKISPQFCDLACGIFFTTMSILSALLVLSRDELRALRHRKILTSLLITLSSIGLLIMLSPQLFIEFTLLWIIGSLAGSLISLELGTRVFKFS